MFRSIFPLLAAALLAASGPSAAADEDPLLFRLDGRDYRVSDLPARLALARYDLEFEHHFKLGQLIDDALFDAHVAGLAATTGREPAAVRAELLATEPPTDAEVETLYAANRERIGAPLDQVRTRIAQFITAQRQEGRKRQVLLALAGEGRFQSAQTAPTPPTIDIATDGFPARGATQPKVTVVEFADYQCPFCRAAAGVLHELLASNPETLRVVYIDFPINPSGISRTVAMGAVCAAEQDRYWDYHDLAFERQRQLDAEAATTLAGLLSLDSATFQNCLAKPETAAQVARAENEARRLGLDSTPSLFLNGRRLILQDIQNELPRVVEAAIEAAG